MNTGLKTNLDKIYSKFNKRKFVHPDPLEFLYNYDDPIDREIAALIASSLAYGRVSQILKSVNTILSTLGPNPAGFITANNHADFKKCFKNFKHRFTTGRDISSLISGIKMIIIEYDSLYNCFLEFINDKEKTIINTLSFFVEKLKKFSDSDLPSLIPDPKKGSACKRLNLFLRWMVREDDVDPGCWNKISASKLIIPLDTHMHKFGLDFGLTKRQSADMKTALEITEAFRKITPEDPVKYDFSITRFGIREDISWDDLSNHL